MAGARRARRVVVDVELADADADDARRDAARDAAPAVAREVFASGVDHRGIAKTSSHGKRARDDADADADADMRDADARRRFKAPKPTYDACPGRKSGRAWKRAATRASTLGAAPSTKTWDERMRDKAEKQRFQRAKADAKAARGAKIRDERARREAKKAMKEENTRRSGVGIASEITNPKTLAKKSAKERAKLKKLRML